MTVKELRKALKRFPKDYRVVIHHTEKDKIVSTEVAPDAIFEDWGEVSLSEVCGSKKNWGLSRRGCYGI